ncbi:iron-dependent peroxidase [Paenibacillus turpanensis]|uniref:iron-dependent peroxidase n=1 Tax=Paenibacillus turpanensis TaxID=2689078 RepID=UPI00140B38F1|nr:iron-dependent peroxidase [Paenibacillus turpanensis]
MNYIWDLIIRAEQSGIPKHELQFVVAKSFSPYMELSSGLLNSTYVERIVEINPHYRFDELFGELLDVNYEEDMELRETIFDILVHYMAEFDLRSGMNKREFHIRFAMAELEQGLWGERVRERWALFGRREQETVAANLLNLYETGEAVYWFKDTIAKLYPESIVSLKSDDWNELLVHIDKRENERDRVKVGLLKELFLPIGYGADVFWREYVGVIGAEQTMIIGETALY